MLEISPRARRMPASPIRKLMPLADEEQKALSRIVLREGRAHGGRGHHRWANR